MGDKTRIYFPTKAYIPESGNLRKAGFLLREMIELAWKSKEVVTVDFCNEIIASASILDEIAKLFDEYPKEDVKRRLRFANMDSSDERLLVHLAKLRLDRKKQLVKN